MLLRLTKEAGGLWLVLLLTKKTTCRGRSTKAGSGRLCAKEAAGLLLIVLLSKEATGLLLLLRLAKETACSASGRRSTKASGLLLRLTEGAGGGVGSTKAKASRGRSRGTWTGVALGTTLLVVHETKLFDAVVAVSWHDSDGLLNVPIFAVLDGLARGQVFTDRIIWDGGSALGDLSRNSACTGLTKGACRGAEAASSWLLLLLYSEKTTGSGIGRAERGRAKATGGGLLLLLLIWGRAKGERAGGCVVRRCTETAKASGSSGASAERASCGSIVVGGTKTAKGWILCLRWLLPKETAAGLRCWLSCTKAACRSEACAITTH